MTQPRSQLLLIDDDAELGELLTTYLAPEGFGVTTALRGVEGVARALEGQHALIILDVMLPDIDGFEVLRRLRAQSAVPVLMLTARGEDVDRIVGLELGADDYLAKPFNPRELVARVRAILRRSAQHAEAQQQGATGERLTIADVTICLGTRRAWRGGELVDLTGTELDLLTVLLRGVGKVVERAQLFRLVLDRPPDPLDRSIDMHVSHLRKKLGPGPDGVERIKSIRGVGYVYTISSLD